MIITTTPAVDGFKVSGYLGIVAGEVALGTDFVRDFMAGLADFFGARTSAYEEKLGEARAACLREMGDRAARLGANAVIGVKIDHEILQNGMMLVISSGTAVTLERAAQG
ncbi:MAG: YbjQ family protein [Bacillota bacterium]